MPTFQVHLGQVSLLQHKINSRLKAQASIDIATDAASMHDSCITASSLINDDLWIKAKPCFRIRFVVSFDFNSSLSLHSKKDLLQRLAEALIGAELWSQLQLRADINYLDLDLEPNVERLTALELEIRQQHTSYDRQPGHPSKPFSSPSGVENVKPPSGVPTILLSAVNISLSFSSLGTTALVPRKRSRSETEGFSDLFDDPFIVEDGRFSFYHGARESNYFNSEQFSVPQMSIREVPRHIHKHIDEARLTVSNHMGEHEEFTDLLGSTAGEDGEDNDSHAFSSQASTLFPSQEASSEVTTELECPLHASSMVSLVDACFRNLICAKPIRTAPGIRTDTSNLRARIADIGPSIFSPGYAGNVAARAPLVPTIARFLTSFLRKGSRESISAEKDLLLRQFSGMQFSDNLDRVTEEEDEEMRLKEVVKTHLWMTMTNDLRDPEASRRLKPLQPFLRSGVVEPGHLLDIEDIFNDHAQSGNILGDAMLEVDHDSRIGPKIDAAGQDDEMVDFDEDDEGNDYESNLMEAFEEHLRNAVNPGSDCGLDPWLDTHENITTCRSTSGNPSPSPMLEEQVRALQPNPDEQLLSTFPIQELTAQPVNSVEDALASTNNGNGETWITLPDEEDPSALRATAENEIMLEPSLSLEDDWEPDFEQWEFDLEQGSEEMLF